MPDHVLVYRDEQKTWRWRRKAANHETVSTSSEGYVNRSHAVEQAKELNPECELTVEGE